MINYSLFCEQLVFVLLLLCGTGALVSGAYYGKLIGNLVSKDHGVRGTVYAASNKRLYIADFSYDGSAPDAFAWMGKTDQPSSSGDIIAVNGSGVKLGPYSNAVVRLDLPDGKTLANYKWLSIWCQLYGVNFGDLIFPTTFEAPAPVSLGTLGFSPRRVHNVWAEEAIVLNHRQIQLVNLDYDGNGPDAFYWGGSGGTPNSRGFALEDGSRSGSIKRIPERSFNDKTVTITVPAARGDLFSIGYVGLWCVRFTQDFGHVDIPSNLNVPPFDGESAVPVVPVADTYTPPVTRDNCEVLIDDTYQVRWSVSATAIEVSLSARINPGTYMAFGLSGSDSGTSMVGSDVTVAWLDAETGSKANAVDYYLSAYQQCVVNSGSGACTDELSAPSGTNDVTVGDFSNENGIITISYTKPLNTADTNTDKVIPTDKDAFVSWSIGPINPSGLAAKHRQQPSSNVMINFGKASSECPAFTVGDRENLTPWTIPAAGKEGKTEFQIDMGQAGGRRGYEGIVKQPGWGIAWYVDNVIIPEITLKRNVTYTFTVNGGSNETIQAWYHPFYITNDPEGGYFQKTEKEREGLVIYAGPVNGSLCEFQSMGAYSPDDFETFEKYRDTALERVCDTPNKPATLTWTPDKDTPDLVYYHCYTHKYLGWKINIVDEYTDASLPAATISMLTLIASMLIAIIML